MKTNIQAIVSMSVPDGSLPALQQLIPSVNNRVHNGEPETLLYRCYLSNDGTACHLQESFPSEQAFMDHLKNVEPVLNELFTTAPISSWQMFGDISPELQEGLHAYGATQNIVPSFCRYISGFAR